MSSHAFLRDPGNLAINQQEVMSLFSTLWITYFDIKVMRQRFDFKLRILRAGSAPGRDEPSQPSPPGISSAVRYRMQRGVPVPIPVTFGPFSCPVSDVIAGTVPSSEDNGSDTFSAFSPRYGLMISWPLEFRCQRAAAPNATSEPRGIKGHTSQR